MKLIIRKIEGSVEELAARACLRAQDKERLCAIKNPVRQQEWLMSKVVVWEDCGARIDYLDSGAPVVENGYISISHGGGYVAVLISDTPCGVDVEPISRDAVRLARKFASITELDIAERVFVSNPALLIWCAKEALYKRVGIPGADFLCDIQIISATDGALTAIAFDIRYDMQYIVHDTIIVVTT